MRCSSGPSSSATSVVKACQNALAQLGEVDMNGLADNYVYGDPDNRMPASRSRIFVFDRTAVPDFLTQVAEVDSPLTDAFGF